MDHEKHEKHENVLFAEEAYRIQGAVFEVSRHLTVELAAQQIPSVALPSLALAHKGRPLKQSYRPDCVCFDRIIVELKVVREIAAEHRAQVLNSLKATGLRLGLLVNFGCAPKARVERLVL